ncbi:MAG: hypothetical protein EOM15_05675 [Spirochaetia bacterium]|nr:hypothetical protein [Spirochaetia bacterium]
MRIATSTNLISFNPDGSKTEMVHLIALYAKEGFRILDINLCEMLNPTSTLNTENWKAYANRLKQLSVQHRLKYNQAHAPYSQDGTILEDFLIRAMDICLYLGIPILVVHPTKGGVEQNLREYRAFVNEAEKRNIILAFENLNEPDEITQIDDLIAIIKGFDSPSAGICYDTGHAHMCKHDMVQDIRKMGSLLLATHIADNHGTLDEHLLPFYGTIDWEAVLSAFKSVGYRGDLTFECMFFNQNLPLNLKQQAVRQAYLVGEYLLTRVL